MPSVFSMTTVFTWPVWGDLFAFVPFVPFAVNARVEIHAGKLKWTPSLLPTYDLKLNHNIAFYHVQRWCQLLFEICG